MSKELEALKEIRPECDCGAYQRRLDVIEEALDALMVIITACACLDIDFISSNNCVKKFENVKNTLKDFEWLKHKLNLTFLNSLSSPEDKERVMKIMGVEYDETYTK